MVLPLLAGIPLAIQIIGAIGGAASTAAPAITGLIKMLGGDKAEEVAGKVIDSAKKVFGTDDPKAIELKVQQDQSAAQRYLADVEAETERYRIEVDDRKSARERDIKVREQGSNLRANLMVCAAFAYVIMATAFIFFNIDDLAKPGSVAVLTFLTTTMGNVVALLGMAFAFEFGSSRGSADKSDQLGALVSTLSKTK